MKGSPWRRSSAPLRSRRLEASCSDLSGQRTAHNEQTDDTRVVLSYLTVRRVETNLNLPCPHQHGSRRTRPGGTMLPPNRLRQSPCVSHGQIGGRNFRREKSSATLAVLQLIKIDMGVH